MPRRNGGGGGGGMPAGFDKVVTGVNDWNTEFHDNSQGAIDWAQNNPWAQGAQGWYGNMLEGNMANNPWMSNLYGNVGGVNMDESFAYLRDFLGPLPSGNGGVGTPGWQGGGGGGGSRNNPTGARGGYGGGGGGGGVTPDGGPGRRNVIPDSTVGSGWFSENIHDLFDPSRLDPANDPTMQGVTDALRRESEQAYWASMQDLNNQMEGAGRYGSGSYQLARTAANEQYNEAIQGQLAALYSDARNRAIQNQMEALGLVNTRDIAAGQISAQDRANAAAARAASYGADAQRDIAMQQLRLQGIGQLMQGQQFGLGLQGNMAELMQNGQLGAAQVGLGFGQLGQSGYADAANFGQLGLGAMQQLGGIYGQAANNRLRQQQMAEEQRRWNEGAPMRDLQGLIGMMSGLNELGGYNMQPGYVPSSPGAQPGGFNWGDFLGGVLGGGASYYNWGGGR